VVEVSGAEAVDGCERATVGGAKESCVVKGRMGMNGEFAVWEHVEVGVDGVMCE
jgi:hypothetical protein